MIEQTRLCWGRDPLKKDLLIPQCNIVYLHVAHLWKILVLSGHNFSHAMIAELPWYVQNFDLIVKLYEPKFHKDLINELLILLWNQLQVLKARSLSWAINTYNKALRVFLSESVRVMEKLLIDMLILAKLIMQDIFQGHFY